MFLVTRLSVKLQGVIHFIQNEETALLLRSTYITINSSACILFYKNKSDKGGGIRTVGFSGIYYKNNVTVHFISITAYTRGGAIYIQ